MRGQRATTHIDAEIARLAERRGGVVARGALLAAGMSVQQIDRRVADGRLRVLHRGVYALGHRVLDRNALQQGAWLAIGETAAVSGEDAAWAKGFRPRPAGPVDLTQPGRSGRRRRKGIELHRAPLPAGDWIWHDDIKFTSPARTLLDLAAAVSTRDLECALDEAHYRKLISRQSLQQTIERNRGRHGAHALRKLLATHELGTTRTESWLEERFVIAYRRHGKHAFATQVPFPPYRADLYFAAQRTIVEVDGPAHRTASRRKSDAQRDAILAARGYPTIRVTDQEMDADISAAIGRVDRALSG